MDTLSPNLDPKSLRIVGASAIMNTCFIRAEGYNMVKFDFPGINLLDSSHHNQCNGTVMFDIKSEPGLPDNTTIFNHAGIFFDDNPVVMTDTVETIIGVLPVAGSIAATASTICVGLPVALIDTATGGVWSSSSLAIAAISSTGIISGLAPGADTISYTVSNDCGVATIALVITVNPMPNAGTIVGANNVCAGDSLQLNNAITFGVWSSAEGRVVISPSAKAYGVAEGADVISYSVTNSCGTDVAILPVTVNPVPVGQTINRNGFVLSVAAGYASYAWMMNGSPINNANQNTYPVSGTGAFTVVVTNNFGCSFTYPPVTIGDCNLADIQVYPNPTESVIYVSWCHPLHGNISFTEGKIIREVSSATQIDISDLPNGIYNLNLYDDYGRRLLSRRITKLSK